MIKINKYIGVVCLFISSTTVAGVNEFCQNLHDVGSVDVEPDVCSNYIPKGHRSLEEVASVKAAGTASISYIYEGRTTDNMSSHPVDDFPTQSVLGVVVAEIYAMAFDENAAILYGVENDARELVRINLSTGALITVGPLTNAIDTDTITGLDIAPDGTCYVVSTDSVSTSTLYTCDLSDGTLTVVGSQSTTPSLVGIAADCDGNIYGHDTSDDSIYTIDPSSGAATLVGATGLAANFAQDITYDREEGVLYGYIYTGGGTNTYGSIDVCSGAVTPLAVDNPLGEYFGGASKTECASLDVIFRNGFDC